MGLRFIFRESVYQGRKLSVLGRYHDEVGMLHPQPVNLESPYSGLYEDFSGLYEDFFHPSDSITRRALESSRFITALWANAKGARLSNLYRPYRTPQGCHDVPFIYLFDGNDLVNGSNQVGRLNIKLDADSEFILRRIAGVSSVAQFFSYRKNSGGYVWTPPAAVSGQQADIGVPFELTYGGLQGAGQIRFDLLTVAKALALSGGTDFLAYIAFQGVKRFPWDVEPEPCAYRLRSYEYVLNVPAVDWVRGDYRRFNVKIEKTGDFELDSIVQVNATNVPDSRTGIFNYMLYDPHKWQMMSAPVPDSYITDPLNGILTTDPAPMPGVFPCPAMLYPRLSQITIDLYATQSVPQGDCWQIIFRGQERIPLHGDAPVWA